MFPVVYSSIGRFLGFVSSTFTQQKQATQLPPPPRPTATTTMTYNAWCWMQTNDDGCDIGCDIGCDDGGSDRFKHATHHSSDPIFLMDDADVRPPNRLSILDYRHVVQNAPLFALDFLICRRSDARYLVGKRRYAPAKDWYFVPGGRVYKTETLAHAKQRILKTELGVDVPIDCSLGVYEHHYPNENVFAVPGFGTHVIVLANRCIYDDTASSSITFDDQHVDVLWLTRDELLAHECVHPYTKNYLSENQTNECTF